MRCVNKCYVSWINKSKNCPLWKSSVKTKRDIKDGYNWNIILSKLAKNKDLLQGTSDSENQEVGVKNKMTIQSEIAKLTQQSAKVRQEIEQKKFVEKNKAKLKTIREQIKSLTKQRDAQTQQTEIERGYKRQKLSEKDEEEEPTENPDTNEDSEEVEIDYKEYFSFLLNHDRYQHKNEYICHPVIHCYVRRSSVKIIHLMVYLAHRNLDNGKEYEKFRIYYFCKNTHKRVYIENYQMYMSDLVEELNLNPAADMSLFYKIVNYE